MSFSDFIWINQHGLTGVALAAVIILLLARHIANKLDGEEAKVVRLIRNVLLIIIVGGYAISLGSSANVSMNHSTIDRSVGDQAQREFNNKHQQ